MSSILKIILILISLSSSQGTFSLFQNKPLITPQPSSLPSSLPLSLPLPPFEFSFKLLFPKNISSADYHLIDDRMMINFILK